MKVNEKRLDFIKNKIDNLLAGLLDSPFQPPVCTCTAPDARFATVLKFVRSCFALQVLARDISSDLPPNPDH
jgi:hypothetical protein